MPVAAGVSQGNCTLILSAGVCHSDNMSAESVERIDWDDDMSSWSSAFDPVPPPPESPKKKQKTRKKKTKKKKKKEAGEGPSQEGPQEEATHLFR